MILLPVGHSEAFVRRIPWVTIVLAAICLVVQLWNAVADDDASHLIDGYARVYDEVMEKHGDPEDPNYDEDWLWTEFTKGQLTSEDDPTYQDYLELEEERKEIRERGPIGLGGYAPASSPGWKMITCLFVHGDWFHLLGNMFFLYLVGCNIEDRWTRAGFLIFYLLGGLISTATYSAMHPDSEVMLVGASGAISAVMGAFVVVMGMSEVVFFYFLWIFYRIYTGTFRAPAWIAFLLYFALDFLYMFGEGGGGGVAYSAHVGGFIFGLAVGGLLRTTGWDKTLSEQGDDVLFERAKDVQAAVALIPTDPEAALSKLRAAATANPDDLGAHDQLVELFATAPVTPRLSNELDLYVQGEVRAGRDQRALHAMDRVQEREDFVASDRSLLVASQAATRAGNNDRAVNFVRHILHDHPRSPLIPRAMWDVSLIQAAAGQDNLAAETRQSLIDRFPDDPFAAHARKALGD